MKKILLSLGLLFLGLHVGAQSFYSEHVVRAGIAPEDVLFSVFLGSGQPMGSSAFTVKGTDQTLGWGKTGVEYGASIMYFVNAYLGFGLEASGMNTTYAHQWVNNVQYKTATDMWNGKILARLTLNPHHPVRVYVPLGVGLAWARNRWQTDLHQQQPVEKSLSYGYMVGLGLEANVRGPAQSIGVEVRYNGFGADLDTRVDNHFVSNKRPLNYFSLLLKFNYRF